MGQAILSVEALSCTRGERLLFEELHFALAAGHALRVAGSNGSGKSSLLRILCGLLAASYGTVYWQGVPISQCRSQFQQHLLYLGHSTGVSSALSVQENLSFAAALSGLSCTPSQANLALRAIGLQELAQVPARALSQGQTKRLALARLWLPHPSTQTARLWILDEAFTALDSHACQLLKARMQQHLAEGGSLIYTTHQELDCAFAPQMCLNLTPFAPTSPAIPACVN